MFDFLRNIGRTERTEYPTWKDIPPWDQVNADLGTVGGDMSKVLPVPENESKSKEVYRVGCTDIGETTLTFLGFNGSNMTLTMTQEACEKLIRMLRATYDEQTKETEE